MSAGCNQRLVLYWPLLSVVFPNPNPKPDPKPNPIQILHYAYKCCRTTCHVTNLYPSTDACKATRPGTCRNMTFTWLGHARPGTRWNSDIGGMSRGSYPSRVTVNSYNGYITSINFSVLHLLSPLCMLKQLCENLHTLEHTATHLFDGLNMAKSHILLNGQFWPAPANRCTDSLVLGIYRQSMSMLSICTSV